MKFSHLITALDSLFYYVLHAGGLLLIVALLLGSFDFPCARVVGAGAVLILYSIIGLLCVDVYCDREQSRIEKELPDCE